MSSSSPTMQAQIGAMQQQLADQLASLRRRNRWTAIIGGVLLLVASVYFSYGYSLINAATEPKVLVDAGEEMLRERIPKVREALQEKIIAAAPEAAELMSHSVLENMPEARISLENIIKERTDTVLKETRALTTVEVKLFLRTNQKALQETIGTLKDDKGSKKVLEQMVALLEKDLGADFKSDADHLFFTMKQLNEKVRRLKNEEKTLEPGERSMRKVISICKRLLLDRMPSE